MKKVLLAYCMLMSALRGYGTGKDTFEVYFPFNISKLTKEAQAYIDQLVFKDTLIHGKQLMVLGYSDNIGTDAHNDTLSQLRAKNVMNYLITIGFDPKDIYLCIGKGKIDRKVTNRDGFPVDRKVQIIISRAITTTPKSYSLPKQPVETTDSGHVNLLAGFILDGILFKHNNSTLLSTINPDLLRLLDFMRSNPKIKISIDVHMEGYDTIYENRFYLSECRAFSIKYYLMNRGIKAERMSHTCGSILADSNRKYKVPEKDKQNNPMVRIIIVND